MNKKEELIQLCESVIEKGGSVLDVSCNEIKCMDCPLSYVNRKDKKTGLESLQFPVFVGIRNDKTEPSYN